MSLALLPLLRRLAGAVLLIGALLLVNGPVQASSSAAHPAGNAGLVSQFVTAHMPSGSALPAAGEHAGAECLITACSANAASLHLPPGVQAPLRTLGRLPLPDVGAPRAAVLTGDPPVPRRPA